MVIVTKESEREPMLGNVSEEAEYMVTDNKRNLCVEKAYKDLTSTMKAGPLQIKSLETGLQLLITAIELQDITLAKRCVEFVDEKLDRENVLMIYAFLQNCNMSSSNTNSIEPSAPPLTEHKYSKEANWVELTDNLRHNCLALIDKHADYILKQKETFQLSYQDIYDIVTRDTLQVSSELIVYIAVYSWGVEECARMTLSKHHLQEVLRHLRYAPRYGLMKKKEFKSRMTDGIKGPINSGILDEKDWRRIKFYIEEKSKNRPVDELPQKMSQDRVIQNEKLNELISHHIHIQQTRSSYDSSTKCDRCIINILTCWTAIFD